MGQMAAKKTKGLRSVAGVSGGGLGCLPYVEFVAGLGKVPTPLIRLSPSVAKPELFDVCWRIMLLVRVARRSRIMAF